MRKLLFLLGIFLQLSVVAHAQDSISTNSKISIGGYGALSYQVQPLANDGLEFIPTVSGGIVFGKQFFIGASFTEVQSQIKYSYHGSAEPELFLESGYQIMGVEFGYMPLSEEVIHPVILLNASGGQAYMSNSSGNRVVESEVIVFNPRIGVQANVFKWMKAEVTGGYQWMNGLDDWFGAEPYNGFTFGLQLRFGKFP